MKFRCFHSFHHIPICRVPHSQKTLIKTLSQVTVGVLLTIDALQVLLLNQDINAFLWGETKVSGETLAERFWLLQALNNAGTETHAKQRMAAGYRHKESHSPASGHSRKGDSPLHCIMPFHGTDLEINSLCTMNLVVRLHLFNFLFAECSLRIAALVTSCLE